MLATILYLLLGLVVLIAVIGFLMPRQVTVERSIMIEKPAADIFRWVAELKTWPDWTVWNTSEDSTLKYSYPGATTGKGGAMHWTAKKMGDGNLKFVEFEPDRLVRYELNMPAHGTKVKGNIEIEPSGGGACLVMWFDDVDMGANPFKRLFSPMLKKMLGRAFERSLEGLKTAATSGEAKGPGSN